MSLDAAREAARRAGGLLSTRQRADLGITRHHLRGLVRRSVVARLARGLYVLSEHVLPDPARVAAMFNGALSYESMLAWMNVDLPAAPDAVHVTVPRDRKRAKTAVPGVRCYRASIEAVLRARLLGAEEFRAAAADARGPRSRQVRLVGQLVDARAGSVLDTYCRVLLWRHGLLPERSQFNLEHPRTGWIGRLDFAWPSLRIALEADGYASHRERYRQDRRRWTECNRAGWLLAVVTWEDVVHNPEYVVQSVRDLFAARAEAEVEAAAA